MCNIAYGHTPIWPKGDAAVYNVYKLVVLLWYHIILTYIFSLMTCPISQYVHKYATRVLINCLGLVFLLSLHMTLQAKLANPTCLQSFWVGYCSVCELRVSNSKKMMKSFGKEAFSI